MRQTIKIRKLLLSLTVSLVFLITLFISPYYVSGDQEHYRAVYSELSYLPLSDGYHYYVKSLSSYEYVHFVLAWVASRYIEKDLFIAFSNAYAAYLILINLEKMRTHLFISIFLVITNYYLFILYFSAERLKYGMIFFLLSIFYLKHQKLLLLFSSLSIISHAQFIIIYAGFALNLLLKKLFIFFKIGLLSIKILYLIALTSLIVALIFDQLYTKFIAYFEVRSSFADYWKMLVFFLLALWYCPKKSSVIFIYIPLFVAVLFFGGERVNVLGYFFFIYYALGVNRGLNLGVLATSLYFAYQSIWFLMNIIKYGDGYYGA